MNCQVQDWMIWYTSWKNVTLRLWMKLKVWFINIIQGLSFITTQSMAAFTHRKPSSTGTSDDSCGAQGSDKRNTLFLYICYCNNKSPVFFKIKLSPSVHVEWTNVGDIYKFKIIISFLVYYKFKTIISLLFIYVQVWQYRDNYKSSMSSQIH